jgi:dTDP-4-amino-4,6-dideoxygalactose transaminase
MLPELKIPVLDLAPEIEGLWGEFQDAYQRVMKSSHFIMGPEGKTFENEMAHYLGVKHAIGVNSGTDALVIGLRALAINPGDEVITTPFTFFATAEAISTIGAIPVFVDIEERTFNLDVKQIEKSITPKTKAIIPVHIYGHACDMDPILEIAKRRSLKVLEDVAQGMGGNYKTKKLGTIGDLGAFSFFPSKNLGAFGDGGLICTNDDSVADQCRMLRVHGSKKKYYNEMLGYNSRLDELQAAFLRVKLPHLDKRNEGRRAVAKRYNDLFRNVTGVTTPSELDYGKHVYHQYTIRIADGKRDAVHNRLTEVGISTMIYYPVPMHKLSMYSEKTWNVPFTDKASVEVLSLPIWAELTLETQNTIVGELVEALG